ncbi:gp182 [Synechococcus phage syn9]|uniref:Gp182 n=1 Tax=Synechococcus phage syn9 TaxID=382359 RepID=Q0QZ43_BPSYS|nr:gp182 [Synechococcus phage syn9]ABA47153.1 gp182 [Synechococcus phage syn9]
MAKLSKTDLTKVDNKTGLLKYWWPFIEMVDTGKSFKLGPQGQGGEVIIASNNKANTKRLVQKMKEQVTVTQVKAYLDQRKFEFPKVGGGVVKVTDLWKENVKPMQVNNSDKIGGRDTEVYSEVLAQYCLAYAIVFGEAATMQNSLNIDGTNVEFKSDVFSKCKQLMVTPGGFNLNTATFRNRLARFGSQPIASNEYWIDTQGLAMLKIKKQFKLGKDVKVFNDKIFDATTFSANPYTAYLLVKKKLGLPGEDKWNPADIWVMSKKGIVNQVHFNRMIKARKTTPTINVCNNFLMEQFKSGDIIPVSLKKPSKNPHVVTVNGDEYFERVVLGQTSNPTVEMTSENRDVKINFTLETIQIPPSRGLKGMLAARRRGNIANGKVVPGSQKHIRIKYHVNNKKIELEFVQTGQQSIARAKMGSLGNDNFTKIINGTARQGVKQLNEIQKNYDDIGVKTDPWFNGKLDKLDQAQYGRLQEYVGEIWKAITKDNAPDFSKISELNNTAKLSSKAMAGEFGLSIAGIKQKQVQMRLITNLYEACASVAFGTGLNKEERALVEAGGFAPSRKTKFNASVYVKVY